MVSLNVLYILTVILYALSVLGYFIDFLQNNRKVNRTAFWLLSIVWVFQATFFILRMIEYDRLPILTMFEGLFFYAWLLVTLSLMINWFFRIDFIVFFTNVVGFIVMSINLFAPTGDVSTTFQQLLISELLIIHVTMVLSSYGAFTLAFIFSIMYILQHNMLKKKVWGKRLGRYGSLSNLDRYAYISVLLGVPLLLLGLILGLVWASLKLDHPLWLDAKVIGSFTVLSIYSVYLYLRVVKGLQGHSLALWNIAAFLIVMINYFLSGNLSSFHLWV
ncbi:cytochrome c biogenesis protein [Anaerobacillus sp. MEB173]|uniref:cytochrome c biogenesis protein n=1 Tax=Anaerobacillus sp. MEB173 TaxID=3383345 RepID=UPI003F92490B